MSLRVIASGLVCVLLALALCSCASNPRTDAGQSSRSHLLADNIPAWAGGEPANAPRRPAAATAYPSVFGVEQAPRTKLLTAEEDKKLRDDLVAARERVLDRAKATVTTAQDEKTKDSAVAARAQAAGGQLTATASN
jgi:hypothetical protein